jgi:hypothetical protein
MKVQSTSSTDPKELLKELKTEKDTIQKDIQEISINNYNYRIRNQLNGWIIIRHQYVIKLL